MRIENERRSVLVTGGVRRLGHTIADTLRKAGWQVITHSSRAGAGDIQCDFRNPNAIDAFFADVCQKAPNLSAIVNNAALFTADDATLEAVNLTAPKRLMELLFHRLQSHAPFQGAIVNILDTRILKECPAPESAYALSKRKLWTSSREAAFLYAPHLRINAVAPGPILPPETFHEKAGPLPLNRRPSPEDVAKTVQFLLETESITGTLIPVNCGQHLV